MRLKTLPAVLGLALAASLGPAGSAAAAPDCYGVVSFDDTYVCVVRVSNPDAEITDGPGVLIPQVCAGSLGCTNPQVIFLPDLEVDGGTVVLFYNGQCLYLQDGTVTAIDAESAADCP